MLFNSFEFILLVSVTLTIYYAPPFVHWQRLVLIAASFIFYAANEPVLLLLLIASIAINATSSHMIVVGPRRAAKVYATMGVVGNLSILGFFKYSGLFATTILGKDATLTEVLVALPLPIGISFFTFQGITLVIDTFRKETDGTRTLDLGSTSTSAHNINTTLYISFFPQLVAGPIVKAHDFLPQITTKRLKDVDLEACFRNLVTGYFLKMVIADNLKDHTFWITFPHFMYRSTSDLIVMLIGFSAQIFADFAGYSLIAIGIAGLFGYKLPTNFNFPYISRSFAEFWRRWHISLSSFLREYLYFPLGGNRKGNFRTYLNLLVVMLLGGLWHGAAWSYMVWGGLHGAALATERFMQRFVTLPGGLFIDGMRILFVSSFVTLAWLTFKLPDFNHVLAYLDAMWTNTQLSGQRSSFSILLFSSAIAAYHLINTDFWRESLLNRGELQPLIYGLMIFFLLTNSGSPGEFMYFQF
jgi:alginate O-acetyltransferase complex protein AlgI